MEYCRRFATSASKTRESPKKSTPKMTHDPRLGVLEDVLLVLLEEHCEEALEEEGVIMESDPDLERYGVDVFDVVRPPPLSMGKMLLRLEEYARCSYAVFLTAGIYMDRVSKRVRFSPRNFQVIYLAACVLALKWLEDCGHTNRHYADVAGIDVADFNDVEAALLFELEWDLQVPQYIYQKYDTTLRRHRLWPDGVASGHIA